MASYYLYKRENGKFYVEFLDKQTGRRIATRSTGETDREKALVKAASWLVTEIPQGKREQAKARGLKAVKTQNEIIEAVRKAADLDAEGALRIAQVLQEKGLLALPVTNPVPGRERFVSFLLRYWDYCESPYIREKKVHGHNIGKRHCSDCLNRVRLFYHAYFAKRPLNSITRQDLKAVSVFLTEKREKPKDYKGKFATKLAASYINKIMIAGTTALAWAFREGMIPADPTVGIVRFSGTPEKRGVLTPREAAAIFKSEWKDKRAYAGNLLSLTTGLRAGEVLAIRKSDIEDRILNIRHSWSTMDGLKSPKNGETRRVPLLPEVRGELIKLLNENPHKADDPYVFYGLLPDKPMDAKLLINGLKEACETAGIDAAARGIVFHSWRHFYAARMADKAAAEEVMRVTGHKSREVFDGYQDHIERENLMKMEKVTRKVMGNIIPFGKASGA
jgi:integrase